MLEFLAISTAVFAVLGIAWYGFTAMGLIRPLFLPSPGQVISRLEELWRSGQLAADAGISIYRIGLGFLISTAIALPIGVLIGCYRAWEAAIEPLVDFIRYMPVVAFVPLTILWTGTGDTQKFLIIFIGTFFQQVLLVMDNVKSVPRNFIDLGRTLEMPEWRILQRIVLPSAMPAHLGLAADQPWLGLDLAGRRRARRRHLRARLPHHHGAAVLPDRSHLRLSPDPRHSRSRHRPGDETCRPAALSSSRGGLMAAPKLVIAGLGKTYRTGRGDTVALRGFDIAIEDNEFVALVGTSGCGKSTLLSIAAGLESHDEGTISIDGEPITMPGLDRGVVFQSYTLLPWLTALGNVEFALRAAGLAGREAAGIARAHLSLVGLDGFENAYPSELSGGMRQRVAIARALSYRPKMLLMDEPFGALDALTRHHMQELLTAIWEKHRLTVLFITHDVEEAIYLSDRVAVMTNRPGRIKSIIPVPLPRPRRYELISSPAFRSLQLEVLEEIRSESIAVAALGSALA